MNPLRARGHGGPCTCRDEGAAGAGGGTVATLLACSNGHPPIRALSGYVTCVSTIGWRSRWGLSYLQVSALAWPGKSVSDQKRTPAWGGDSAMSAVHREGTERPEPSLLHGPNDRRSRCCPAGAHLCHVTNEQMNECQEGHPQPQPPS
jgi:hypothetical protein